MAWGVWSLFPTVFSKYSLQIVWKEHDHQCIDNEVGIKASGNSLIGRFIALHSLHIVRHDIIHITIRIMNWLTRAASPKTWRFVFSDAAAASYSVCVCVCVCLCVCLCVCVWLKTHFSLACRLHVYLCNKKGCHCVNVVLYFCYVQYFIITEICLLLLEDAYYSLLRQFMSPTNWRWMFQIPLPWGSRWSLLGFFSLCAVWSKQHLCCICSIA